MNYRAMIKVIAFSIIAGLMAAMEIGTLTGPHVGTTHTYYAMFGGTDGVSGLRDGNEVKVAGVAVGKVDSVSLLDANHAKVTFEINNDQTITTNSWALVRYANLIGQRYLAITQSGAAPGRPMPYGSTIPASHTQPALSLTALFNGFRPLFAALTPDQVNELSQDVIDILQGQSSKVGDLVARTASLTTNLAARDDTFTAVLDSLTTLLTTVSKHDNQLAAMLTALRSLGAELHAEGPSIFGSLNSVDGLIGSVGDLLKKLEDHNLPGDVADIDAVTGVLAQNIPTVNKLIDGFNTAFGDFARVSQNGSYINAYICGVKATTLGKVSFTGSQALIAFEHSLGIAGLSKLLSSLGLTSLALLNLPVKTPLILPTGAVGPNSYTKVCSR